MRKIYVIMIILFSVLLVSCNFGNDFSTKNIDKVFQVKSSNENDEVISYGSAIIFNNEGILITNAHVISYFAMGIQSIADHIYVKDNEKNDYREVAVLKYDFKKDIAFLLDSAIIGKEAPIFSLTDLEYNEEVPEILTMNFSAQCRIDNGAIVYEVTMQDKDGVEHTDIVNGYVFDNGDVMLLTDEMEPIYLSQDNESNVEQCGWFTNLLKSAFVKVVTTVAKIKYAIYKTVSDAVIAIGKRVLISIANSGNIAIIDHVQAITNYNHNKNLSFPSSSYATYSGYIINQNYFENWKIGVQNIKHSGCGIIAIYNALRSFGKISSYGSTQKFASLISEVESESGLLLLGQFGVTPAGIERGLLFNGIGTMSYTNQNLFLKRVDAAPTGKHLYS